MVPKLDSRTAEDLKQQMERLAASYTPQWRYHREHPDMGSVMAELFVDLMAETLNCYNQMPEYHQTVFLDALGADRISPRPAAGYVVFSLARNDMPETGVPKGTEIAADVPGLELILYRTRQEIWVTAAELTLYQDGLKNEWYLHFDNPPGQGVLSLLVRIPPREGERRSFPEWEYLSRTGWKLLPVEDDTEGLSHSGLIRFAGAGDWLEEQLLGQAGHWLRVKQRGPEPMPQGPVEILPNAAPVCAVEPGMAGNLPAGSNLRLMENIGFVAAARNPDALTGGCDQEEMARAVPRSAARIRHQFKAVTPCDFEGLVYEICPDVLQVKCFSGYDGFGKRQSGAVTVVVLAADYQAGRRYFYSLKEQISRWLAQHAESLLVAQGNLTVTGPVWVRVHVTGELCAASAQEVLMIQRMAQDNLVRFFDPVRGNHDGNGWTVGEVPEYGQIHDCLLLIEGVNAVLSLSVAYEMETVEGYREVLWEQLRCLAWKLPEAGDCRITVTF